MTNCENDTIFKLLSNYYATFTFTFYYFTLYLSFSVLYILRKVFFWLRELK